MFTQGQGKSCLCAWSRPVRFIITDAISSEDEEPVRIVCKVNCVPKLKLELDTIVKISNVEVRRAWLRDQIQPEAHLVTNLQPIELAINLPTTKRRRGMTEWLGQSVV